MKIKKHKGIKGTKQSKPIKGKYQQKYVDYCPYGHDVRFCEDCKKASNNRMTKKTKGYITITLAMTVGLVIIGAVATFYKTGNATDTKINETKEFLVDRISDNETEIAVLKNQITNIEVNTNKLVEFLIKK